MFWILKYSLKITFTEIKFHNGVCYKPFSCIYIFNEIEMFSAFCKIPFVSKVLLYKLIIKC